METTEETKEIPTLAIVSIEGKKAGAQIIVNNLIVEDRDVIYLTGFGPSQEVRAFSQLLGLGGSKLVIKDMEGNELQTINNCTTENLSWVAKGPESQAILYSLPKHTSLIIGDSEDECRNVFYRILKQAEFVLEPWFDPMFRELQMIPAAVGTKRCYVNNINVPARVCEGVRSGVFTFPAPTAELTITQSSDKDKVAA